MSRDSIILLMDRKRRERQLEFFQRVEKLLNQLNENEFFGKSQPPFDHTFVDLLIRTYGEQELRKELNKMYAWLKADPRRVKKNYRKFVVNWMNNREKKFFSGGGEK